MVIFAAMPTFILFNAPISNAAIYKHVFNSSTAASLISFSVAADNFPALTANPKHWTDDCLPDIPDRYRIAAIDAENNYYLGKENSIDLISPIDITESFYLPKGDYKAVQILWGAGAFDQTTSCGAITLEQPAEGNIGKIFTVKAAATPPSLIAAITVPSLIMPISTTTAALVATPKPSTSTISIATSTIPATATTIDLAVPIATTTIVTTAAVQQLSTSTTAIVSASTTPTPTSTTAARN